MVQIKICAKHLNIECHVFDSTKTKAKFKYEFQPASQVSLEFGKGGF
ncbi:hypothetical protein [Flavobacterium aquicola]|nr:hypothetical protein [Flavobacterium aquicola]